MKDDLFEARDRALSIIIDGCRLVQTCIACPEQYDVRKVSDGTQIGYLRLRHGYFRADCPDVGGDTVYEAHTRGDGCFDDDERMPQLQAAVKAINAYWANLLEKKNDRKNGCRRVSGGDGNCATSCNGLADCAKDVTAKKTDVEPRPGFVHPSAYSGDVLQQLQNWRSRHIAHTAELMDMAIAEIVRLRNGR